MEDDFKDFFFKLGNKFVNRKKITNFFWGKKTIFFGNEKPSGATLGFSWSATSNEVAQKKRKLYQLRDQINTTQFSLTINTGAEEDFVQQDYVIPDFFVDSMETEVQDLINESILNPSYLNVQGVMTQAFQRIHCNGFDNYPAWLDDLFRNPQTKEFYPGIKWFFTGS